MTRKRANEYGDSNPFMQSNNPFEGQNPFGDAGATDDGMFAPEPTGELPPQNPDPEPEVMTEAETTRPRQVPSKLIPVRCSSCMGRFRVGFVHEKLVCLCGADALDLDFKAAEHSTDKDSLLGNHSNTYLISWELKSGDTGQSSVTADRDLDAIRWLRVTLPIQRITQIWEMPSGMTSTSMEGDPPWGQVVEGDQPLGLLDDPELFPQFDDGEDIEVEEDLEEVVAYILRDNPWLGPKAVKLATKMKRKYYS